MTGALTISDDLMLPIEAVVETFAILAKRGAGKTFTASVMVEELVGAGQPVVVIDPVGVWFGLRSSADGEGPGLPVVIFGGDHADLPLPADGGRLIADLVIDERRTEWGWRGWSDVDPESGMALRDEEAARQVVADHPGTVLVHHQVGPWTAVADTTDGTDSPVS